MLHICRVPCGVPTRVEYLNLTEFLSLLNCAFFPFPVSVDSELRALSMVGDHCTTELYPTHVAVHVCSEDNLLALFSPSATRVFRIKLGSSDLPASAFV